MIKLLKIISVINSKLHLGITCLLAGAFCYLLWWSFQVKNDFTKSQANLQTSEQKVHSLQSVIDQVKEKYEAQKVSAQKTQDSLIAINENMAYQLKKFEKDYKTIKAKYENYNAILLSNDNDSFQLAILSRLLAEHDKIYTPKDH